MQELRNQPKEVIGRIVQNFIEEGKGKIIVKRQPDGKFTIQAS